MITTVVLDIGNVLETFAERIHGRYPTDDILDPATGEVIFEVEDLEERTSIDDFGCYAQRYPSLLYSVGVGRESGSVGSAMFLPDERAIEVGEEFMTELALSILNK